MFEISSIDYTFVVFVAKFDQFILNAVYHCYLQTHKYRNKNENKILILQAKMNQQRSRRFRSSKEREALLADYVAKEGKLPDEESFDSNCITPGTEFMFRLGK